MAQTHADESNEGVFRGRWKVPFPLQTAAVAAARSQKRGVMSLSCGSGKSRVIFELAVDGGLSGLPPERVLVVGGRRHTSAQLLAAGRDFTTLGDSIEYRLDRDVFSQKPLRTQRTLHITSYDFVTSDYFRSREMDGTYRHGRWDLVILDEAHLAMGSETWSIISKDLISPTTRVIGLTGTPFRKECKKDTALAKRLNSALPPESAFLAPLGDIFFSVSMKQLEDDRLIAKHKFCFWTVPQEEKSSLPDQKLPPGEIRDRAALNANKALALASIVAKHRYHPGGMQTGIIFVTKLFCAEAFTWMIDTVPCMAGGVVITGSTSNERGAEKEKEVREAMEKLEAGEIPFAIMSMAFEAGINVPSISYVATCDGVGFALRSDLQKIGRVSRNPLVVQGGQKQATVYTLSMERTHEMRERQALIQNLLEQGYREAVDVLYSDFDVATAKREVAFPEELLARIAKKLADRQETNAGTRNLKAVNSEVKASIEVVKQNNKIAVQTVHPLFRRRKKKQAKAALDGVMEEAAQKLAVATEDGMAAYRAKREANACQKSAKRVKHVSA